MRTCAVASGGTDPSIMRHQRGSCATRSWPESPFHSQSCCGFAPLHWAILMTEPSKDGVTSSRQLAFLSRMSLLNLSYRQSCPGTPKLQGSAVTSGAGGRGPARQCRPSSPRICRSPTPVAILCTTAKPPKSPATRATRAAPAEPPLADALSLAARRGGGTPRKRAKAPQRITRALITTSLPPVRGFGASQRLCPPSSEKRSGAADQLAGAPSSEPRAMSVRSKESSSPL
mmetsp:Transcript_66789/g.193384  ORF Transcript_66789/g.193384 Transcript_66789/m.193384 type:complete len:230 (-) Transcript_66789:192-881(-)